MLWLLWFVVLVSLITPSVIDWSLTPTQRIILIAILIVAAIIRIAYERGNHDTHTTKRGIK